MADWHHRPEVWKPVLPEGQVTDRWDQPAATYSDDQLNVTFVINDRYATRIQQLIEHAQVSGANESCPSGPLRPASLMLAVDEADDALTGHG